MDTLLVVLIVVLIIVIMVRGPKTLPLIGGMLGRGVKEARKEASEFQKERDDTPVTSPRPPRPPDPPGLVVDDADGHRHGPALTGP